MDKQIARRDQTIHSNVRSTRQEPSIARPATDILEQEDGFHIIMDMPGVRKDNLVIDLSNNDLVVSAKSDYQATPSAEGGRRIHHFEFGGVEYRRTFTISDSVDRERITAKLENGVVDLFLPKSEKLLPKRIEVSAG